MPGTFLALSMTLGVLMLRVWEDRHLSNLSERKKMAFIQHIDYLKKTVWPAFLSVVQGEHSSEPEK